MTIAHQAAPEKWPELRKTECPVCGHKGRCKGHPKYPADLILCFRQQSDANGFRWIKQSGDCGTFVRIGSAADLERNPPTNCRAHNRPAIQRDLSRLDELCAEYIGAITEATVEELAETLGVGVGALRALDIGFDSTHGVAVFPERGPDKRVVGFCARLSDGTKAVGKGERRGFYIPNNLEQRPGKLISPEGASDTAALLTMGYAAIGRPNNASKADDLAVIAQGRELVILGDDDDAGRKGAVKVAKRIGEIWGRTVPVIFPPSGFKDVRELLRVKEAPESARAELEKCLDVAQNEQHGRIAVVCAADVECKPVNWLWDKRFPLGAPSLIPGDPGLGKSLVSLDMVGRVTTGRGWPDSRETHQPVGDAIVFNCEDDASRTIVPRLISATADLSRVQIVEGVHRVEGHEPDLFDLGRDVHLLGQLLKQSEGKVRIVIFDPLSCYLGMERNANRDNEVRAVLAPLGKLAERYQCSIIGVMHLNKASATMSSALHRVLGSVGFVGMARAAWLVSRDPETDGKRLFTRIKGNLAPDPGGLRFDIRGNPPAICWEDGVVEMDADRALATPTGERKRPRDDCMEWLRGQLKDGPVLSAKVNVAADMAGISSRTLARAREDLGIIVRRLRTEGSDRKRDHMMLPEHAMTLSTSASEATMPTISLTT